jgi:demethylmenaquinone methyltransferase/2-methoxy-6-polyprenyl-1,4-benzoquinol methylase
MLVYAWMVFVEHAPERYDLGMRIMTLGRLDRIKDLIAATVKPGEAILDLGCGTGTLALRCLKRGAAVTGLDSSAFMLDEARRRAAAEGLGGALTLIKDSVTQTRKHFPDASFDTIMATAALGEFAPSYLAYIFKECRRLLRPGGRLVIADEMEPRNPVWRALYRVVLGICWIPQFLIVRRVCYPIRHIDRLLAEAGFGIESFRGFSLTSLKLIEARVS